MVNMKYILSFDGGTSGIKAVLAGTDGSIRGMANAAYPLPRPQAGWAEQIPSEYWRAACEASRAAIAQCGAAPEEIIGVVFSTQWKGMVPLDCDNNVLHNSIIWMDIRATEEARELSERLGRTYTARDYWPRVMWFKKHYPELYEKTVCILESNSYLKYRACGCKCIDVSNNFIHSPLAAVQAFFDQVMEAAQLESDKFPPFVSPSGIAGYVLPESAEALGVAAGTPVFGGLCDIPAVAAGAGASAIGKAHIYLGTSGWIGLTRALDDHLPLVPMLLAEDRWIHSAGMSSACMTFDWTLRTLYSWEWEHLGSEVYSFVEKELSAIPAGSDGVCAVPSLNGDTWPFPVDLRGGFTGLRAVHTRAHMVNAMLEGICQILRLRKTLIERSCGGPITSANAVGGGAGSDHWMQMMANVLNIEICVPENARYAGALGSAYCAMIGLGLCADFDDCSRIVSVKKRFYPQPETQAVYQEVWEKFLQNTGVRDNVDI